MDDEALSTPMCQVESMVNGKPITVASRDLRNSEPLTPSHLLLLRGSPVVLYENMDQKDNYSSKRWRQVNYLATVFWRRWTRE
ncbi:hypothetical protein HOLleu_01015 [Holothuria leucospilota]|uniref:Uncharacterized protein n=1 Tax=Holothuria leucospilota TaxID=206669 RepID=A0A9Q1HKP5_HOLLE|nr:hypothetical protein HOLleu_01015 [Holothuria leucospilota]